MTVSISKTTLDNIVQKYINEQQINQQEAMAVYIDNWEQIQEDYKGFYKIFNQSGLYCQSNDDLTQQLLQNFIDVRAISNFYTKSYLTRQQFEYLLNLTQNNDQIKLTLEYTHLCNEDIQDNIYNILAKVYSIKQLYNDVNAIEQHHSKAQFVFYNIFEIPNTHLSHLQQLIICNFRIRNNHNLTAFLSKVPQLTLIKMEKCYIRESDFDISCVIQMNNLKYVSFYGNQLGFGTFKKLILHIFTGEHSIRHLNISNNNIFKGIAELEIIQFTNELFNLYREFQTGSIQNQLQSRRQKVESGLFESQNLTYSVQFGKIIKISPCTPFELLLDGIGVGEASKMTQIKNKRCFLLGVIFSGMSLAFDLKLSVGGIVISAISDIVDGFDAEALSVVLDGIRQGETYLGLFDQQFKNRSGLHKSQKRQNSFLENGRRALDISTQSLALNLEIKNKTQLVFEHKISSIFLHSNQFACKSGEDSKKLLELLHNLQREEQQASLGGPVDPFNNCTQTFSGVKNETFTQQNSNYNEYIQNFNLQALNLSNTDIFHGWSSRNSPSKLFAEILSKCSQLRDLQINSENPHNQQVFLYESLKNDLFLPNLKYLSLDQLVFAQELFAALIDRQVNNCRRQVDFCVKVLQNFTTWLTSKGVSVCSEENQFNLAPLKSRQQLFNGVGMNKKSEEFENSIIWLSVQYAERKLRSFERLLSSFAESLGGVFESLPGDFRRNLQNLGKNYSVLAGNPRGAFLPARWPANLKVAIFDGSVAPSFFDVPFHDGRGKEATARCGLGDAGGGNDNSNTANDNNDSGNDGENGSGNGNGNCSSNEYDTSSSSNYNGKYYNDKDNNNNVTDNNIFYNEETTLCDCNPRDMPKRQEQIRGSNPTIRQEENKTDDTQTSKRQQFHNFNDIKSYLIKKYTLAYFTNLQVLSIGGCKLQGAHFQNFLSFIQINNNLQILNVTNCSLKDTAAKEILNVFITSERITKIFNKNNSIYLFMEKNPLSGQVFNEIRHILEEINVSTESDNTNSIKGQFYRKIIIKLTNIKQLNLNNQQQICESLSALNASYLVIICQFQYQILKNLKNKLIITIICQQEILKGQCIDFNDMIKQEIGLKQDICFDHQISMRDALLYHLE